MSKPYILALILLFSAPCFAQQGSGKMIDLIPSLYGGDGLLLATAPAASHTAHFSIQSAASINRLNQQIAAEIGGFPFSSSVGGFAFAFDPAIGDFVHTTKILGPVLAERGATLGRNHLNFNLSFTHFEYNRFSGEDLNQFSVDAFRGQTSIGFPDVREQFEQDIVRVTMDLDIRLQILALSGTYGLLNRLDIGFLVPLVRANLDVKSETRVEESAGNTLFPNIHRFEGGPESPTDQVNGSTTGIGDIILRAKYHLLKRDWIDIAGATLVQLGTADRDEFLGTGDSTIRPFLVFSRTFSDRFTPHLNVGYEFNLDRDPLSAFEYAVGFDYGNNKWTLAGELLSSHEPDGDGIGDNIVNTSWGIKWNPKSRWLLSLNTQIALNDAGLRSTLVTMLGLEYGF